MGFSEILQRRRLVRHFNECKIPRGTLIEIVKGAQRTPSWANSQPWRVYLATGDTLQNIKKGHYAAADHQN